MTTRVEIDLLVNVPVSAAYNQWTQIEDFPQFMGGVKSITQLSDDRLEWVAEIAGVRRQWQAKILEQVPDRKIAWAATEGATNAGAVTFEDVGGGQTRVNLILEYEPEGPIEKVGDKLNIVENQAEADLERFKAFIESERYATGAWRGSVNEDAAVGTRLWMTLPPRVVIRAKPVSLAKSLPRKAPRMTTPSRRTRWTWAPR
jgi:uncharacterized membrane protein